MRSSLLLAVVLVLAGCGHATSPPKAPAVVAASAPSSAIAPNEEFVPPPPRVVHHAIALAHVHDGVPLSIRRILTEQHSEIHDVLALTAPLGDPRGRVRATNEATALANELGEIETALGAAGADSERYDETVVRLRSLATRVELLHEALRGAVSSSTAVQVDTGQ
jgi:hypothetical protein